MNQQRKENMHTTHVVWLSGGKDSTAMALRLAETQPETDWRFVCTPTGNELPDVYDHWERIGNLLGKPLERVAPMLYSVITLTERSKLWH